MDEFVISDDIYKESKQEMTDNRYVISLDILEETASLTPEVISRELMQSFHFSGRYWIWKMTSDYKNMEWKNMYQSGEMRIKTNGLKYLKSYTSIAAIEEAYSLLHPDRVGIKKFPPSFYAFANYLRIGDVVLVTRPGANIFCWGIVESGYMYRPNQYSGKHFRKMKWFLVDIPFIYTKSIQTLYQIPKDECNGLKENLISNITINVSALPFDF